MPEASEEPFPYHRIIADLRTAIHNGELAPGDRLPSEWMLAERYGTSRPTVRRAIAVLRAEGMVLTEQGRGAFVRPTPPVRLTVTAANYRRHRQAGLPGFNAQALEQGRRPEQRLLEVGSFRAQAEIAARLGVTEGDPVVVRRRLFLADERPLARCDSYYRADLADGTALAGAARIRGGALALIEDQDGPVGRSAASSVDELTARMPSPAESEQLHLPPGVPVVRILRTIVDGTGLALEVQETVAAADRHDFRYEVDLR